MNPSNKNPLFLVVSVMLIVSVWLYSKAQYAKLEQIEASIEAESLPPPPKIKNTLEDKQTGQKSEHISIEQKEKYMINKNNTSSQENGKQAEARMKEVMDRARKRALAEKRRYAAQYKDCKYLHKVENLQDLIEQLLASAYTNCLRNKSTKELEKIWGVTIYEADSKLFYTDRDHAYGKHAEDYQQAINKPYRQANDAYVITRTYEKKDSRLYISGTKDYLRQQKGLNQWVPDKFNGECPWNVNYMEIIEPVNYPKPDLLEGFIEPLTQYYTRTDLNVAMSFSLSYQNNYVKEITASVLYK